VVRVRACFSVKYTTADTQILTTKGQIPKVAVSGVSGFISGVFMGSPLVFGGICPRTGWTRSKQEQL